ncbi:hypothetical protein SLS64_009547 [Diaporthe eres]|uniref:DUF1996 domain-containing protein n=1 Tax=Diaporthe eres TaxID=83184 RepID=A0ABR1NSD5_DIAER
MTPVDFDPSVESTCTSCTFSEDFSNYWTANLYFRARNGTFKRVPQMLNLALEGGDGGITVYYIPPYDGKTTVTAFKPNPFGGAPCTGSDTTSLPTGTCGGGIRTTITFPTCWDGKNVDSPDHKAHVAYPSSGSFESTGPCPSTHPVRLPQLMYEVMWDTTPFNDPNIWPEDGSQPFVYSTGDPELKRQPAADAIKCTKPQFIDEDVDGWMDSLPGGMPVA